MRDTMGGPDPLKSAARTAARAKKLGPDAACALCWTTTPAALTAVNRTLLERHHVAVRANDPELTVPLCRNCHVTVTERQREVGAVLTPPSTILHQVAAALASLAAFFLSLGERCAAWAAALSGAIAGLDANYAGWQERLWAAGVRL